MHGVPLCIISDRGTQFTSHFWKTLQGELDNKVKLSTTFHPQMNNLVEQTIHTLEYMLSPRVIVLKSNWNDHLLLIKFAYNNSYQSSITMAI